MWGYYGKIPTQGDFIRKNADVGFVRGWDDWLQRGMATSREYLGAGWQEAYENAPIWRFCFGAGVCGPDAMIGVLMPSMDRVGRCFPLTLFCRLKQIVSGEALTLEPFMTGLEDAALNMLTEGNGKKHLEDGLAALAVPDFPIMEEQGRSYWLSTFFGGVARQDKRSDLGLPAAEAFNALMCPDKETCNV